MKVEEGKRPSPKGYRLLRIVSIAIGVVTFVVLASVMFSAFADYRSLTGAAGGTQLVTAGRVINGQAATFTLNATVSNGGLYALDVTMACTDPVPAGIVCAPAGVTVQPGAEKVLTFRFTVVNFAEWSAGNSHQINATVMGELVPFASITVGFDLGTIARQGGP